MLVETRVQLLRLAEAVRGSNRIGFDTEWEAPTIEYRGKRQPDALRARLVGYSLATSTSEAGAYVPLRHADWAPPDGFEREARRLLADVLARTTLTVVAHNWKGEIHVLGNEGYVVTCRMVDSMLSAWMAGWRLPPPGGLKLKSLVSAILGRKRPDFEGVAKGRSAYDVPVGEIAPYAAQDAVDTLALANHAATVLRDLGYARAEEPRLNQRLLPVMAKLERAGIQLDADGLLADASRCEAEMVEVERRFTELTTTQVTLPVKVREPSPCPACAGTGGSCSHPGCVSGRLHYKNGKPVLQTVTAMQPVSRGAHPGNDRQVSRWLFEELKWWPTTGHPRNNNGWSVSAEDIRRFTALPGSAGEACRLRLRFQALRKYSTTYTRGLVHRAAQSHDGRLHCGWHQTGTATSRFSSSGPNLQNLPSSERQALPWLDCLPDIRARFIARPGFRFVVRDLSQIELRLAAHYSRDPNLTSLYRSGGDVHANTMARVGCDRRNAKVAIFSILYEITPRTLARKLSMATEDWGITEADAQRLIDGIYSAYPGLRNMQDDLADAARRSGYAETLTGFKRLIPARSWCGTRGSVAHTRRIAINTPIQGSAGGIMKRIMLSLSERWGESGLMAQGVTLLAQVHDELLVEAPESLADQVNAEMAEAFKGAAPELRVPLDSSGGIGPNWSEAKHG